MSLQTKFRMQELMPDIHV